MEGQTQSEEFQQFPNRKVDALDRCYGTIFLIVTDKLDCFYLASFFSLV
jgi:hypothetical protein